MPICRAERATFTSWPVRPFTLEAAQSSRNVSVLVPLTNQLTRFDHKHLWITLTNQVVGLFVRECRSDEHDVIEVAVKRAVDLVHHEP